MSCTFCGRFFGLNRLLPLMGLVEHNSLVHAVVHHVMLNIVSTCVVVDSHDTGYVYSMLVVLSV